MSLGDKKNMKNLNNQKGFTLIELLVVVAIVGILAAIAIPQFAEYRTRAFNSTAVADLRNSITAQEAGFVDNDAYTACADTAACEGALPGFKGSDSVDTFAHVSADGTDFQVDSMHAQGNLCYEYDSNDGSVASAAACS